MDSSREYLIEDYAGDGRLDELKEVLGETYSQHDIDLALGNAIAYSQISTAEYLLSIGADISHWDYDGTYYAVHNNEIEGVNFSLEHGVDANVNEGILLATSVITAFNEKDHSILELLLDNGVDFEKVSATNRDTIKTFETEKSKQLISFT